MVKKIIIVINILLLVACSCVKRPTNITRNIKEKVIADLNTDFFSESIVVSPDGRHIAYIEDVYSGLRVVVNDSPKERYDDIGIGTPVFSPTSKFVAYFVYYKGYSGGIFGLFAEDSYWKVVVDSDEHDYSRSGFVDASLIISPDGAHVAYGAYHEWGSDMVYDYVTLPGMIPSELDSVDSLYVYEVCPPFIFSPDCKTFVYVGEELSGERFIVKDQFAGKSYDYVYPNSLVFSPNGEKLAYIVVDSGLEKVVVNGIELAGYTSISESSIRFSPDSQHLAYFAYDGNNWLVIKDGEESMPYDDLGQIIFSPDSKHLAYTAKDGNKWIIIKDEKVISQHSAILENTLTFSPDSRYLVYAVEADSGIVIYENSKPTAYHQALVTPPIFSSDGQFLVYTVEKNKTQSVVINGNIGKQYPAIISHNGGRVAFDNNNSIHYLVVKDDNNVYLVEEQIFY
ncbi:MAG: PD40 domain-containing protein [Candidatus Cloacimonetes bacterium]|nr:PD40 domain-containing protein [Candidatus Cloacimonadota bacterium]